MIQALELILGAVALTASLKNRRMGYQRFQQCLANAVFELTNVVFETSSELSVQSKSPSQRKREEMHSPLAQMKFFELHVTGSEMRRKRKMDGFRIWTAFTIGSKDCES